MAKRHYHNKQDHGLDYGSDSEGSGELHGAHFGHGDPDSDHYQPFHEILLDWQVHLGIGTPKEMLEYLGLHTAKEISPQDWQDMTLGTAAPNPSFIDALARIYDETRSEDMPSTNIFTNRARSAWTTARTHRANDEGLEMHIISISPEILENILRTSPRTVPEPISYDGPPIAPVLPHQAPSYASHDAANPMDTPFYKMLTARLAELNKDYSITKHQVLSALADSLGLHPWMLQGYMPLTRDRHEVASTLITVLFDSRKIDPSHEPDEKSHTIHATKDDDLRVDFANAADDFFQNVKGLNFVGAQRNGMELTYGGLLSVLMKQNNLDNKTLAAKISEYGYRVLPQTVAAWQKDRYPPHRSMTYALSDIIKLNSVQRREMANALDLNGYKRIMRYKITKAFEHSAGTEDFKCQTVCAAVLASSKLHEHDLSYHLGLYPSSLQAFSSGDLIPSPAIIRHIGEYFDIGAHYVDIMERLAQKEWNNEKDVKKKILSVSLGSARPGSNREQMFRLLAAPDSPFAATLKPVVKPLIHTLINDTPYTATAIRNLQDRMELPADSNIGKLLEEVCRGNPRKPFGMMLEDYVTEGGNDLTEFLERFMSQDKGWNLKRKDFQDMLGGLDKTTLSRIMENHRIYDEPILDKFTEAFHLKSASERIMGKQEQLFWQLARGDKTLPSEEQIVREGWIALNEGNDPVVVARRTAQQLWDRSGLSINKLATFTGTAAFLDSIRNRPTHDLPNHKTPLLIDALANGVIAGDVVLKRQAANVMLGISREKSPKELLDDVRNGNATFGTILKTIRKQRRMSQKMFGAAIPYRNDDGSPIAPNTVGGWERDEVALHRGRPLVTEALADWMGYDNERDRKDFIALATQQYVPEAERRTPLQLLQATREDQLTFSGFIGELLRQRGQTQEELGQDIGVSQGTIGSWIEGGFLNSTPVAQKIAQALGFTEATDIRDFVVLGTGRYVPQSERRSPQQLLQSAREGLLNFGGIIQETVRQRSQWREEFAQDLGVHAHTISEWIDGAFLMSSSKAEEYARVIGFTEPADVHDFVILATGRYIPPAEQRSSQQLLQDAREGKLDFAGFIKESIRQRMQWTEEFAHDVGMGKTTVLMWTYGKRLCNLSVARSLSQTLGLTDPADERDCITLAMKGKLVSEEQGAGAGAGASTVIIPAASHTEALQKKGADIGKEGDFTR